jgi:hypothetical protein
MTYPKKFPVGLAPPGIVALVKELMPQLLAGDDPVMAALREQYARSRVGAVELSGAGFFADIEVPDDAPMVSPPSISGGDAKIVVEGVQHGAGCVLFVRDGRLSMLEGYTYGNEAWSESAKILRVTDVFSLQNALRRAPAG